MTYGGISFGSRSVMAPLDYDYDLDYGYGGYDYESSIFDARNPQQALERAKNYEAGVDELDLHRQQIANGQEEGAENVKDAIDSCIMTATARRGREFLAAFDALKYALSTAEDNKVKDRKSGQVRSKSDAQIHKEALELLEQACGGSRAALIAFLKSNFDGQFSTSMKHSLTFGLSNDISYDQIEAKLFFKGKEDATTGIAKVGGNVAGIASATAAGAATGAVIGAALGSVVPGAGTAIGAGVGAIAGGAYGLVSGVVSWFN